MKNFFRFLRENWSACLTIIFLIVVGILLLANPAMYAGAIIRVAGILFGVFGILDIIKYFRTEPREAAKGSGFYSGALMISVGAFCLLDASWFVGTFPVLAVCYGVFQILLGYRKLQRSVDALRMKTPFWWMRAISAGISIFFGFIVTLNPGMTLMSISVFTGLAMIIEGLFDAVAVAMTWKKTNSLEG